MIFDLIYDFVAFLVVTEIKLSMTEMCCGEITFSIPGFTVFTKIDYPTREEVMICSMLELKGT